MTGLKIYASKHFSEEIKKSELVTLASPFTTTTQNMTLLSRHKCARTSDNYLNSLNAVNYLAYNSARMHTTIFTFVL